MRACNQSSQKKYAKLHRLTPIAVSMVMTFFPGRGMASDKLDMSFIQGGSAIDASIWDAINGNYIPGQYLVDLSLNGKKLGKQALHITPDDKDNICFPRAWLSKAGIFVSASYFKDTFDESRQCYVLAEAGDTKVDLDVSTQTLSLSVPQLGLEDVLVDVEWNFGVPALRFNYNANMNINDAGRSVFGSASIKANIDKWVVNGSASATANSRDIAVMTASRPLQTLQADLTVGKTFAGGGMLGSAGIYGATLSSNSGMRANDLGYAPVFSGVAKSEARVTLRQNGSTIYSEMMPPGPFAIRDVILLSSGDVTMNVMEKDGSVHTQLFPLTVMAGMITPGKSEYTASFGVSDGAGNADAATGPVAAFSYGYGLQELTLKTSALLHRQYQGAGLSLSTSLGELGGVSLEGAFAQAKYDFQSARRGARVQMSYSKSFASGTGLGLSWARSLSQDYVDFSSFAPKQIPGSQIDNVSANRNRDQFNVSLSQNLGRLGNLNFSGWRRSYWQSERAETGLSASLSTQIKGVTLSLGSSQTISGNKRSSQSSAMLSVSFSVPFTLFERRYSAFSSVSASPNGVVNVSGGVSGSFNDRTSYSVSASRGSDGSVQSGLSGSYAGDKAALAMSMNQSARSTTGSLSASGSVLALPTKGALIFSRTVSDTVAVVNIPDTAGVKMQSGLDRTDGGGNVVVPLNGYRHNTITVDAATLPTSLELGETSRSLVPAARAVTWVPFETLKVRRYLFQVKLPDGGFAPSGAWAFNSQGMPLGFIAQHGVLMINALEQLGDVRIGTCTVPAKNIRDTSNLQEVMCETTP
ncbi:PefC/AfrB family outer membrane usher protein [Chromobacterium violaceum]|uniref:PefC/AfrB family outer membrane usher protein n=1 Tax=Chromobacterium violaceum TaxID=536 RepID=UPI001B31ACAE|nr:PefC/AfrB family outer membrane usher protein [Chromobacterium violaceum]MBP4047276.1 PefC/AfrB family outer membrane usher protein [Chromobacterium violaceum]